MGNLTKAELAVLYSVVLCFLLGAVLNIFFGYSERTKFTQSRPEPLLVNINKASEDELLRLPGMGKMNAQRTVEYRQMNGSFRSKDEIMKVKGIGSKKYDKMKRFIIIK